jgi:hypothetical protein
VIAIIGIRMTARIQVGMGLGRVLANVATRTVFGG